MARKRKKRAPRRVPRIPVALNQHAPSVPDAGKRAYKRNKRRDDDDDDR